MQRQRIELTKVLISACGWVGTTPQLYVQTITTCSMGLRSGLLVGQLSMKSMLFVLRSRCWRRYGTQEWCSEWECHRGTVEHLNCHQWWLVVNDNNGQWLPRPWQNPHPWNDSVQEHNSQHSVHFSYSTRTPCHHHIVKKILVHAKKEWYYSIAVFNECVHVSN